ncbi:MAG: hypothetical protein M1818_001107 [Claussenomyces sp. TS43310]|nr:MAG: hypothetical protein M1818_001107 [Claussenomyces sp. TS43310]
MTASSDIFQPIATDAPPPFISSRSDHPVPRLGIVSQDSPLSTNKFYANFFLGSQTAPSFSHPYSVAWVKGSGPSGSWGLSVGHVDTNQRVYGPTNSVGAPSYFINPVGIQSLVLSALELGNATTLSMDSLGGFSVNVNLLASPGASPAITFPLVQGMGFVTGLYTGATPIVQTGVFFRKVTRAQASPRPGITKYVILLEDGTIWLLYAYSPSGATLEFTVVSNGELQATSNFTGTLQIAKDPGNAETLYDATCGAYATAATLSGTAEGIAGTYSLNFINGGLADTTLAMFALPHHVQSFSAATNASLSSVQLQTTTKGIATAVLANSWTLVESHMPTSMDFAPWSPSLGSRSTLSAAAIAAIETVATSEVSQDMFAQSNLNSFYYGGKGLAKFAGIIFTINDLLNNATLAQAGLANLKIAFELWSTNKNEYPLVYDSAWGGVVSTASYATGDSGVDFGNTYYNDHHFHYGYFIYAAAVIGYLDPAWLAGHKDYVNTLARDIANPSTADNYFPISRSFDWYHGHSWAHGLYEAFDGKDEESSSEDAMSAYAIKMWGRTIGDANMEARGNLQLAITARSLQNYFLYETNNTVEPSDFIKNKVSGILFENKMDHTTYFGTNIEYIQGIHMIPLLPSSTLTRTRAFVTEEWESYFSNGRAGAVVGGWKGLLYANLAITDPVTAFDFFDSPTFDTSWLDGGASRTWYLALAAGESRSQIRSLRGSENADGLMQAWEAHENSRRTRKVNLPADIC